MFHGLSQSFLDHNAGRYDVKYFPLGFTSIIKKDDDNLDDNMAQFLFCGFSSQTGNNFWNQ